MVIEKEPILIIGGAGYIGSHMTHLLAKTGYFPIVLDNLSSGTKQSIQGFQFFYGQADDEKLLKVIHQKFKFNSVIHFSGFITASESVIYPLKYYLNNVGVTLKLLDTLLQLNIKNVVFSSSASIYGESLSNLNIKEHHPKLPLNPYGRSKWMIEQVLEDLHIAYGINIACLRYFNVAGGNSKILAGKRSILPMNLIPVLLQAVINQSPVIIFGTDYPTNDGTCIRDYIHIFDVCAAHLLALDLLRLKNNLYLALNLGTGKGYSVLEIIKAVEQETRNKIELIVGPRRKGDPAILVADGTEAKKILNWKPKYSDLKVIIKDAWTYELNRFS